MKAISLRQYGSAKDLALEDLPDPKVGPSEVRIKVKAAGINPVDWKLAAGNLDQLMQTHFPLVPGWDVAGVVEKVGLDVDEFSVGDEVYGYIRKDWAEQGAYAQLTTANVRLLARKPRSIGWAEAAAVPLAGLTAYQSIRRAKITAGDTVLIHAAAGGVGVFATQIAVAEGARVIGTASQRNHDFLKGLGAEPVEYGQGLADRVRQLAPDGVDAALDFIGSGAVELSNGVTKRANRVVSITDASALESGGHYVWARPDAQQLHDLAALIDEGKMSVTVERTFPLEEAAEAWRASQAGHTRGKLVLTVE